MPMFAHIPLEPDALFFTFWVASVFVPFGVAVLGSLLTFAGAWFIASRTELYRRLSRWEPYSEQLRSQQIELYGDICQAAREAMVAAYDYVWNSKTGDPEHNKPLVSAHRNAQQKMESLGVLVPILASSHFNNAYKAFSDKHSMFSTEAPDRDPPARQRASTYGNDMQDLYPNLLNAARTSLGTDELDEKARQAIMDGIKNNLKEKGISVGQPIESHCQRTE